MPFSSQLIEISDKNYILCDVNGVAIMENYLLHLNDLPRELGFPIPLDSLVSYESARGTFNGVRPDNIEFAFRLESPERYAIDMQDSIQYENTFPHLFIKMPGSRFRTNKFRPRRVFVLIYDGKYLDLFRNEGIPVNAICWPIVDLNLVRWLIRKMNELVESLHVPGIADRLDSLAWTLLHEVVLMKGKNTDSRLKRNDPVCRIQQIASFYRRHYTEKIDLDVLLSKHGFSRRTFYRYWAQLFKQSPKQYQLFLRLQEAARLLSYNNSVSEVAGQLNLTDVSNFTEQFQRQYGVTPGEYKRQFVQKALPRKDKE